MEGHMAFSLQRVGLGGAGGRSNPEDGNVRPEVIEIIRGKSRPGEGTKRESSSPVPGIPYPSGIPETYSKSGTKFKQGDCRVNGGKFNKSNG
jgi:hypothetical protein